MSGCQGVEKKGQAMSSNLNYAAINALVAERVMGWRREVQDGTIIGYRDQNRRYRIVEGLDWAPNQFDPSRNIAHAMEMAMKVTRAESIMELTLKNGKWTCTIVRRVGFTYPKSGAADTPALAICLAALRAEGVPDKDIEEVCDGL